MTSKKDRQIDALKLLLERERTTKLIGAELDNLVDLRDTLITVIKHMRSYPIARQSA
ncbi:MAG: hypothetical protein V1800_08890 [Candidatus Latescibacterota bacterium]